MAVGHSRDSRVLPCTRAALICFVSSENLSKHPNTLRPPLLPQGGGEQTHFHVISRWWVEYGAWLSAFTITKLLCRKSSPKKNVNLSFEEIKGFLICPMAVSHSCDYKVQPSTGAALICFASAVIQSKHPNTLRPPPLPQRGGQQTTSMGFHGGGWDIVISFN